MEGCSYGTKADIPAPLNTRPRNSPQTSQDVSSPTRRPQGGYRRQRYPPPPSELPVLESRGRLRETRSQRPHKEILPQESGCLYPSLPDEELDAEIEIEYVISNGNRTEKARYEASQTLEGKRRKREPDAIASDQPSNNPPTPAFRNVRPKGDEELSSDTSSPEWFPNHPLNVPEAEADQNFQGDCVNFIVCELGLEQRISKQNGYGKGVGVVANRLLTPFGAENYWHSMKIFGSIMRWDPAVFPREDCSFEIWRDDFDLGRYDLSSLPIPLGPDILPQQDTMIINASDDNAGVQDGPLLEDSAVQASSMSSGREMIRKAGNFPHRRIVAKGGRDVGKDLLPLSFSQNIEDSAVQSSSKALEKEKILKDSNSSNRHTAASGGRAVNKDLKISCLLKRREQSNDRATNDNQTILAEKSAQETSELSLQKPINQFVKKISTIFRPHRGVDDDKAPPRQRFEAPSPPPLPHPSIAMTYNNAADSAPTSLPHTPRLRRTRRIVSGEEIKAQNSLDYSSMENPSPSQMSNFEKENKKSSRITNSRNTYETAPTSPKLRTPQEVSSVIVSASTGTNANTASEAGPRPQSLKPPASRSRRKENASSDPDPNVKLNTNQLYSAASLAYPDDLGMSGLSDIESKPSTSKVDPSPLDVTPGSRTPTLLHVRARNISEPEPATLRMYEGSEVDKSPSRSGRPAERVPADNYQGTGQYYAQEPHNRSCNTVIATAAKNHMKMPVKSSEPRSKSLSQPSLRHKLSPNVGSPPLRPLPPPPISPPTPSRRMPRRYVLPSPGSPIHGFDGAEDLLMIENSNKVKCASTGHSTKCEVGREKSKHLPSIPVSPARIASEDGSLLKRVEQHGVYTITYGTETEDDIDESDDEAETESEGESLTSYGDVEGGELEFLEEQSDDEYPSKLECPDLYQFRYFDGPEQHGKERDVGLDDSSKYDVSIMDLVHRTPSDGEYGPTRNMERNVVFIKTQSDRAERDLQQSKEANLGEFDSNAIGGSCCVLPSHVVEREDTDIWIGILQACSFDKDGQRSTNSIIPAVHQIDQRLNLYAGFSEIGGGCVRAESFEEGGILQLRASGKFSSVKGDSPAPNTMVEQLLDNAPYYVASAQPANLNIACFSVSLRYPRDLDRGHSHNKYAERKAPLFGNTLQPITTIYVFTEKSTLPDAQLDGSLDPQPELSPTRSTVSSSDYQPSFSTRQSFQQITQRLLSTSSTPLLPLLEPSDSTLEPRKYNPDSSSTESLCASAMNPIRRRATTAGNHLNENQSSPSPRRVRFEDSNDIENASLNRVPGSRLQADNLTSRDASLSSQASNQLSASSQVVPFALDERITSSRSQSSRRLPFHDLPDGHNPYGDALNNPSSYDLQHPLFNVTREGPPQSSLYASPFMEHGPSHDISFSDDIFGGPLQAHPNRDLLPQPFSSTQGLHILYDDPPRVRMPHSLQPNNFTVPHTHERASESRHSRRRREAHEPSYYKDATTSEADNEAGKAPILNRQPTPHRHVRGELTSPLPIASHSGHKYGFDHQPSTRDYELQDWSSVNASKFQLRRPFGSDRQHTARGYSRDDSLSQYPSPHQSGPTRDFAYQPNTRGHDFQGWSSENPTASRSGQAFGSVQQPVARYNDRYESLSQYSAPAHSGHTPDLTNQQTARGHDSQGWSSEHPTTSQADQISDLDRHPRAYDSISQYPSIRHSDRAAELTNIPGDRGHRTQDEYSEGSIDSRGYSATGLFRGPRVHGRDMHGSVHRDATGFQAYQDTLSSILFDTRGRTAQNPSPEASIASPTGGISRSMSASPKRAPAAGPPQLNKPLPSLGRSRTIGGSVSTTRGHALASPQLATGASSLGRSNTTGGSTSPVRRMYESPEDLEDEDDGIDATSSAEIGETSRPRRHREPTKDLFGPRGILSRPMTTEQMNEQSRQQQAKSKTALKRFKEKVRTIKSDVRRVLTSNTNTQPSAQAPVPEPPRHPPVSLSPTIQARLFGELELILTTTVNTYLKNEMAEGRMSLESVEKMVKKWKASHQPMPTEFMFDLGTQLRLVQANCEVFRFYGEHQGSAVRIHAMFKTWEDLAKRLNRRTLATPDAEIRKYVADISNILALLGASAETWTTFEFWRSAAVVAIEAVGAEERARAAIPWGVTRQVYSGPE